MGPESLRARVAARHQLIEDIRDAGIDDLEILHLFDRVPRHLFVPEPLQGRAYRDEPIAVGAGGVLSRPSTQAACLQLLAPGPDDRVLEIGTGPGFLTALLALCADRVFSVERDRNLSAFARTAIDGLGLANVALHVGDGSIGWRRYSPYDVIVVTVPFSEVPVRLVEQLADPGRMFIPLLEPGGEAWLLVRKDGGTVERRRAGSTLPARLLSWSEESA